ncbi:MAG: response regulator [Campylobacterota bacterium]|nr:response regulator [Campylobacterota bacterium]
MVSLYVEDEVGIRQSLSDVLKLFSKELYIAKDGLEGLELYKKNKPDIVITDIKMPNMNGIELVKEIKKIEPKQHIIFTTAHSESDFFMEAIEAQVDGYILKPIDLDKLEQKINSITAQINLQCKYEKQQIQLIQSEKMAAIGEMIANIAHQWRQPLSVISTGVTGMQIEKKYGKLTDELFENTCNTINNNAQYLSQTIDDFRNFIKGDTVKKEFDLKELLESTFMIIDANMKNNNIILIKDIDKKIILKNYSNELKQSLINILNNAKDALLDKQDKYIFISLEKNENNVDIIIKDNGGGIAKNIIKKYMNHISLQNTMHKGQD